MQTTSKRRSVLLYNPVFIEYGNTTTEFCSLRIYNKICCVSDDLWSCPRGGLPVDVGTMASPGFDATDVVGFIMSEHVDGSNAGILWNNPM